MFKMTEKKSVADWDTVIASLKSKLNKNNLNVLEQIGKSKSGSTIDVLSLK